MASFVIGRPEHGIVITPEPTTLPLLAHGMLDGVAAVLKALQTPCPETRRRLTWNQISYQ